MKWDQYLLLLLIFFSQSNFADNFPNNQIHLLSPYPPGGGTDLLARKIGQNLSEHLSVPVIVENRPGANGTLATGLVAKSIPDGNTIVMVTASYPSGASLYKKLPYDQMRDLAPVTLLGSGPLVLVMHPSLPISNVKGLIEFSKKHPGEINFGNSGFGSIPYLSAQWFSMLSETKITHISYKGPGAALIDVISGQVPLYFMNILGAMPLINNKKLRSLGVTTIERSSIAPDWPTINESGLKGYEITNWYGLLVQGATPKPIIEKIHNEMSRIMALPEVQNLMKQGGMSISIMSPIEFSRFLNLETIKYSKIIIAAGIKAD